MVDNKTDKRPPKSVPDETPPESCDKVDKQKTWAAALAFRKNNLEGTAHAQNLLKQIATQEAWEWARAPATQGKIEMLMGELQGQLTPFMKRWVTEEPGELKKTMDRKVLDIEVSNMSGDALLASMAKLKNECAKAVKRHSCC